MMSFRVLPCLLTAMLILAGCAGQTAFREGKTFIAEGRVEEGLERLGAAVQAAPGNAEFRLTQIAARERAITAWLDHGESARAAGQGALAERYYRRILGLEPNHTRAKAGLEELARQTRHQELMTQADAAWSTGDREAALLPLRKILAEAPLHTQALALRKTIQEKSIRPSVETKLSAALRKPISIEFKETPLRQVFEVIARTSGLNFVFDKDVRTDQKTTVFLRDSTIQDAVNVVLLTNQLEQRILDKSSILIYPSTPAKARDYQPLSVKTFFLSNSDVKSAANTIKTIIKTKDLVVDERQNMLIMRDTPEAVRLAERLMALHDLPEPEVMLEVEILEVKRTRLQELGIRWPDQLTLTPLASSASASQGTQSPPSTTVSTSGVLTVANLRELSANTLGATITPVTVNAKKQDGDANLLANPRIRTRSRESAKILIGERVPNITTTSTATGFVSESVQYVDVGLKLDVQPTIYPDNEIAIKLSLEVSSIVNQVQTKSGTLAYQIGTRTASSVLRLRDGENQVLAGLINDEDRSAANKVPGLGEIPLLGRLFGSQRDETLKTEIVLSITPRLIRNLQRPPLIDAEFDAGTEASFRSPGTESTPASTSPTETPANSPAKVPPPSAMPAGVSAPATGTPPNPASASGGPTASIPIGQSAEMTALQWQGPGQVRVGESFTVILAIQPGQPLTSIPYSIGFDPKLLEVVAVTPGDFLKQGGVATSFSNRVDRTGGQILATETRPGTNGAANPGSLAAVTFRAVAAAPGTKVQVLALAPVGEGGRSVSSTPPSPLSLSIRQ